MDRRDRCSACPQKAGNFAWLDYFQPIAHISHMIFHRYHAHLPKNERPVPSSFPVKVVGLGAAFLMPFSSPSSIAWGDTVGQDDLITGMKQSVMIQNQNYEERVMKRFESLPPFPGEFPDLKPTPKPMFYKTRLDSNDMKMIFLEDHEVPMIRGFVSIKGGSRMAPSSNPALAALSVSVQRAGGSSTHPGEEFDAILETLSARIEAASGSDSLYIGFSCLSDDARTVLGLVSELLQHPNVSMGNDYAQSMLELRKSQTLNALEHKNDNAQNVPFREIEKLVYGKDSIYVAEPTKQQISGTSLGEIEQWISEYENPENTVVGIVGDFNTKDMEQLVKESFEDWSSTHNTTLQVPNPGIPDQTNIRGNMYIIDRPNLRQSTVVLAKPGIGIGDPDEIELGVFGEILNSFGGVLFDSIRSKQGLAYSVSAGIESTPIDHKGLFVATAQTDNPVALVKSLFETLEMAVSTVPSDEEFSRAQQEALNSFIFSMASFQDQLQRAVIYETFDIPEKRLYEYVDKVRATTPRKVQAAATRLLDKPRDSMVTMIIGDAGSIIPDLSKAFPDSKIVLYTLSD